MRIKTLTPIAPSAQNVVQVYRTATAEQVAAGLDWYREAHEIARDLDPSAPRRAAGVIAALSPMMQWTRNVELARRAYAHGSASGALGNSVRCADAILSGTDPLDVLKGQKVRNFFALIADPDDAEAVCVDRHATDIAIGRKLSEATRASEYSLDRVGRYELFADCYRAAAELLDVTPAQAQAVTWVAWRTRSGQ